MNRVVQFHLPRILLICQLLTSVAAGSILNVPGDYDIIQNAIEASSAGDTVLIDDGHYYERLQFPEHALTLGSHYLIDGDTIHAILTTVDADTSTLGPADTGCVVYFPPESDTATQMIGLTIKNGIGLLRPGQSLYRNGGGVYCAGGSPIIEKCIVRDNRVTGGGGGLDFVDGSEAIIRDCLIEANVAELYGAGAASSFAAPNIVNCRFVSNQAIGLGSGGGLDLYESEPIVTNCWFEGNSAAIAGGGISIYNSPAEIDSTVLDFNSAYYGGTMYVYGVPPKISQATILHSSGTVGGGFYLENSSITLSGSIIAFGLQGTAVTAYFNSEPTLSCCDIYANTGGDWLGNIADQLGQLGNFSGDPMFCGALISDYTIDDNSPCAPGGSCANLIGAMPVGCSSMLSTIIEPNRFSVAEGNGVPPRMASIVLGNFDDDIAIEDVDLGSLRINDSLIADLVQILPAHPDFSGSVIEMILPLRTIIDHYGMIWDTLATAYTVTGTTTTGDIILSGPVTILGHISGDLNRDGSRDISDLVAMVDFFFHNGSPPPFPEAADMNHDGSSDISDLIGLVGKLFPTQPQPPGPR